MTRNFSGSRYIGTFLRGHIRESLLGIKTGLSLR